MAFKKESKGTRGAGTELPLISLRKSTGIGINGEAYEQFFNGSEHAVFYFDEENNKLGIEPVEEATEDSYKITVTENSASVVPTSILKRYQLTPEITTRYEPEVEKLNEDKEIVTIDLDNPHSTYGSPVEDEEED